jgi:hypothetical protein
MLSESHVGSAMRRTYLSWAEILCELLVLPMLTVESRGRLEYCLVA